MTISIKETIKRATKGQFTAIRTRPDGTASCRSFTFINKTATGRINAEMTVCDPAIIGGENGFEVRRVRVQFRKDGLRFIEAARAARGYSKWVTA